MMRSFMFFALGILILAVGCATEREIVAEKEDDELLDVPNQAYLGQELAGDIPVVFAPGLVSAGENEMSVCLSPDSKVFYLFRTAPIYTPRFMLESRWTEKGWTRFQEVSFFDHKRNDSYHFYAPDGKRSYFQVSGERVLANGKKDPQDLFYVEKTEAGWGERTLIDFGERFAGLEAYPTISLKGELYFSALYEGKNRDLFFSRLEAGRFSDPQRLPAVINSPRGEYHPFIAPDGSYIIYDSAKENGFGGLDLWINFRNEDGSWGEAINLGQSVNSQTSEMRPYVSPDGKYLFFASDRRLEIDPGSEPLAGDELAKVFEQPGNGLQDIYWMKADFLWELKNEKEEQ
jgi:hypothetical protein